MFPLIGLRQSTGVVDKAELERAVEASNERRASVGGGGFVPSPRAVPRVPEAVERARAIARRSERAAVAAREAAAGELRKAEENVSDTDDASSSSYDSDSDSGDPDAFGALDGAAINADHVFDRDRAGRDELYASSVDEFLTIDDLESIIGHMQEAYDLVFSAMEGVPDDRVQTLFGIATRLRADMGLLRGMRRAMTRAGAAGALIRSPTLARDVRQLDEQVQLVAESPRLSQRALDAILPVIGMLVYIVAAYYFPGMPVPYAGVSDADVPVVYPYNNTNPLYLEPRNDPDFIVIEPLEAEIAFVPNVTPTQTSRKSARGVFHKMVSKL